MPGREFRDYVKSGRWKCEKSPTGAHHWIEAPSKRSFNSGIFYCKWCYDAKEMPVTFEGALEASGIRKIPAQRISEISTMDVADIGCRPSRRIERR